jgi:hypothetical protein
LVRGYCEISGLACFNVFAVLYGIRFISCVPTPVVRVLVGTLFIAAIASILFFVKLTWVQAYAVLEIGFALAVAAQTMYSLTDTINPVQSLGILTSAYLMIWGLDNSGPIRRRPDPRQVRGLMDFMLSSTRTPTAEMPDPTSSTRTAGMIPAIRKYFFV